MRRSRPVPKRPGIIVSLKNLPHDIGGQNAVRRFGDERFDDHPVGMARRAIHQIDGRLALVDATYLP